MKENIHCFTFSLFCWFRNDNITDAHAQPNRTKNKPNTYKSPNLSNQYIYFHSITIILYFM